MFSFSAQFSSISLRHCLPLIFPWGLPSCSGLPCYECLYSCCWPLKSHCLTRLITWCSERWLSILMLRPIGHRFVVEPLMFGRWFPTPAAHALRLGCSLATLAAVSFSEHLPPLLLSRFAAIKQIDPQFCYQVPTILAHGLSHALITTSKTLDLMFLVLPPTHTSLHVPWFYLSLVWTLLPCILLLSLVVRV